MSNLTKYICEASEDQDGFPVARMLEHDEGEWVKFADVAELLQTAERTLVGVAPTTAAAAPCHRCKDYELILDVNFCPFCGFEFVRE